MYPFPKGFSSFDFKLPTVVHSTEVKKLSFIFWSSPASLTVQGRFSSLNTTLCQCKAEVSQAGAVLMGMAVTCSNPAQWVSASSARVVTGARASWQVVPAAEHHLFWHFCQTNLWKDKHISGCAVRAPPTLDHLSWSQTQLSNTRSRQQVFICSDERCTEILCRARELRWRMNRARELKLSK